LNRSGSLETALNADSGVSGFSARSILGRIMKRVPCIAHILSSRGAAWEENEKL
jgi:hypothetical protein